MSTEERRKPFIQTFTTRSSCANILTPNHDFKRYHCDILYVPIQAEAHCVVSRRNRKSTTKGEPPASLSHNPHIEMTEYVIVTAREQLLLNS